MPDGITWVVKKKTCCSALTALLLRLPVLADTTVNGEQGGRGGNRVGGRPGAPQWALRVCGAAAYAAMAAAGAAAFPRGASTLMVHGACCGSIFTGK
ncbi:hypothetical protein ARTHROSP310_02430 [Arthrobacter sp. AD-310]